MNLEPLIVDTLATYRLTRLVTSDVLTARLRARIVEQAYASEAARENTPLEDRVGQSVHGMSSDDWLDLVVLEGADAPRAAYLVTCHACAGVWIAAAVAAARLFVPGWTYAARALALAAAQQLLADR